MSNDIDRLSGAMLLMLDGINKLTDMVENMDIRIKKLEAAKPSIFYPQYSPNEWPQPTKWNYPEYPTAKWNVTCGIKNADSN